MSRRLFVSAALAFVVLVACACNLQPRTARTGTLEISTAAASATTGSPAANPSSSPTSTPKRAALSATPKPAATATLAVGPGPQRVYQVQQQPAPGSCHYNVVDAAPGEILPDPRCTPGAVSPAVTQQNLASTICKKGYTASVRPPVDVTNPEKYANAASYGYTGSMKLGEYDHLVPLELGGDPNDPRNLWLGPKKASATSVNNPKDGVESSLNYLVCNALHNKPYLPLAKAQELIATNWLTAKAEAQQLLVNP